MSHNKADRVFNVGPGGQASIDDAQVESTIELPPLPKNASPDEVIFLTHILSLKTAALVHLGVIKEYGDELDIETAKQIIDTLEVLEKRTQGHLSFEEARHLEASIKELKMVYLSVSK
jgi:hypothetical protein